MVFKDNISKLWDNFIATGEIPAPYSLRDGKLLKLVPKNERVGSKFPYLQRVFETDHHFKEACSILENLVPGNLPTRAELAWARSLAYLRAGNAAQALHVSC